MCPAEKRFRRVRLPILFFALVLVAVSVLVVFFLTRHPISINKEFDWAIGIYEGDSPLRLSPMKTVINPVIKSSDVTDVKAESVADPFMLNSGGVWYMFFEVMNSLSHQGDIGCATSQDGRHWNYQRIVLDESFHLSYPYVFQSEGQFYMIPESNERGAVRLYRAKSFPYAWEFVANLTSSAYADCSVFFTDDTWWMFVCSKPATRDELRLFFADKLTGPWTEHPASPLIQGNATKTRPAGRVLLTEDTILRFSQDDQRTYGREVLAFFITEISRTNFGEKEFEGNPILGPGSKGRNRHGMHHIDAHEISPGKWIAAVDGYRKHLTVRIEH